MSIMPQSQVPDHDPAGWLAQLVALIGRAAFATSWMPTVRLVVLAAVIVIMIVIGRIQ